MTRLTTSARRESWPLAKPFVISRETMTHTELAVFDVTDGTHSGRGEACPTPYFGETPEEVMAELHEIGRALTAGESWDALHDRVEAGAARNAVDCAMWDLRAKQSGRAVWELLGMRAPRPVETVYTIGLAEPAAMAAAAVSTSHQVLKLKLGAQGDVARVEAIRAAVPGKRLIVDVNEGWSEQQLREYLPAMAAAGVELVEQPLPAGSDAALADVEHLVPIGADESCHTSADLERVALLYDVINIKLDKTGGLTEAMRLALGAQAHGLQLMVGCMLGTSLAMAPAILVAQLCRFVDLDAPLLIGRDREPALHYLNGHVTPGEPALWG